MVLPSALSTISTWAAIVVCQLQLWRWSRSGRKSLARCRFQPATAATWSLTQPRALLDPAVEVTAAPLGHGRASSRTSVRPRRNRLGPAVGQHIHTLTAHRVDCDGALPVATRRQANCTRPPLSTPDLAAIVPPQSPDGDMPR